MTCGKPVIGSRVGGLQELITHGTNGLMFTPHSDIELAENIKNLLCDDGKMRKMGKMARRTVEKKFTDDIMAEKTIQLYHQVLEAS